MYPIWIEGSPLQGQTLYEAPSYSCCIYENRPFDEKQAALACAYHEAGHAIAGMAAGMTARDISIRTDACGRCGAVKAGGENKGVLLLSAPGPDVVMMLAAGVQAELIWLTLNGLLTDAVGWVTEAGGIGDQKDAQDVAQYYGHELDYTVPSTMDPYNYPNQQVRAQVLLASLWDNVVAVAEELAVKRTLTAADVMRLTHTPQK
ncbi:hypothetical protein GCM10017562_21420 [Streptomyces roseofulvus]|uniref:hypothetical protein n=1 Tax=Streptomyces roseofulvus TaxID=33902 RepID=UPI0031F99356